MRACLLRGRPLVVRPGRLRLVVQSGLDECACGPCRDLRLLVWRESAQVLKDDQCLPSDDHRHTRRAAATGDPRRRHLGPRTPLAAHSATSITGGIEGIPALWARRPLCSRLTA